MGLLTDLFSLTAIVSILCRGCWAETCLQKNCIITAANLIDNMNTSTKACENFYQYSCGMFDKKAYVSWRNSTISTMSIRYEEYISELRVLLHEPKNFAESESIWKAKDFYTACMISDSKDKEKAVKNFIKSNLGGWPLIEGAFWKSDSFDWIDTVIYLNGIGFQSTGIFDVSVVRKNANQPYQLTIYFLKSPLWHLISHYNQTASSIKNNLYTLLFKIVKFFKPEDDKIEVRVEEINDLVNFIVQIYFLMPYESKQDFTLYELSSTIPQVNWERIFQKLLKRSIGNETMIHVENYLPLDTVLSKLISKRTIANYIILNFLASLCLNDDLFDDYVTNLKLFLTPAMPVPSVKRVFECVEHASQIRLAVSSMHFKKYFTEKHQIAILDMEKTIREIFLTMIQNTLSSIDGELESALIRSLMVNENAIYFIGSLEEQLNDNTLDQLYSLLPSHPYDHFANLLYFKKFKANLEFENVHAHRSSIGIDYVKSALKAAKINYEGNTESGILSAEIPLSLMRGLIFGRERSTSFNYGTLGILIAKALILYLTNDIVVNIPDQYQFILKLVEQNQKLDNFAQLDDISLDRLSIKIAYLAYKKWLSVHKSDVTLPGLNNTNHQLFWIGYANTQCSLYEKDFRPELNSEEHLLNVLKTVTGFSQDFQCRLNEK